MEIIIGISIGIFLIVNAFVSILSISGRVFSLKEIIALNLFVFMICCGAYMLACVSIGLF